MTENWPRPLSYSSMKELAKSPAHIVAYWKKDHTPPTKQQKIGKLYHKMVLTDLPICELDKYKIDEIEIAENMADEL